MAEPTYVIGHVNPDTDSIAAALGYAWLLHERDGIDARAARAGALNPQSAWVLKKVGIDAPPVLTDASPRFQAVARRLDTIRPAAELSAAWALASQTGGIAPVVDDDNKPFGLINGLSLFKYFAETVGPRPGETPIRELIAVQCRHAADVSVPRFTAAAHIRDSLHRILHDEHTDYWVVDETGHYVGIARQRELLDPPRLRLILVDHNEPRQAIAALEEADLLEILDHHRLGNPHTHAPIRFTVDTVGSTSTLVSEQTADAGLAPTAAVAGALLAGLLSDTLLLRSPTTTARDREAAERLARWAFVSGGPLHGETVESFGKSILSVSTGLTNRKPGEIVATDTKTYEAGGFKFAIAQAEVTDLLEVGEHREKLLEALNDLQQRRGLDFAMLLVTDVVGSSSRLLVSTKAPAVLDDLPYPPLADGVRDATGIVSRKKQLLPAVLGLLER